MAWCNGFSWDERVEGGRAIRRNLKTLGIPAYGGPCMLCGDPEVVLEMHAEDYGPDPYAVGPPGFYRLCRHCHRSKLHTRFRHRQSWKEFQAHVRRGGYARDLRKGTEIRHEYDSYRSAKARGELASLRPLRDRQFEAVEWWERLTMDEACSKPGYPKPRPAEAAVLAGGNRFSDWTADTVIIVRHP